jgi:hypothetical protein
MAIDRIRRLRKVLPVLLSGTGIITGVDERV